MPDELNASDNESESMNPMPEPGSTGGMRPIWGILIVVLVTLLVVGGVGYWYWTTEPGSDTSGAIKYTKSEEEATGETEETLELVTTSASYFDYAYPEEGWHVSKKYGTANIDYESDDPGNQSTLVYLRVYFSRKPIFNYPSEVMPAEIELVDYEPDPNNNPSQFTTLEQRIQNTKDNFDQIISEEKVTANNIEATKIVGHYGNQEYGPSNYNECVYFFSYLEEQNNITHVVEFKSILWEEKVEGDFELIKTTMEKMFEQFKVRDTSSPAPFEDMQR